MYEVVSLATMTPQRSLLSFFSINIESFATDYHSIFLCTNVNDAALSFLCLMVTVLFQLLLQICFCVTLSCSIFGYSCSKGYFLSNTSMGSRKFSDTASKSEAVYTYYTVEIFFIGPQRNHSLFSSLSPKDFLGHSDHGHTMSVGTLAFVVQGSPCI